MATAHQTLQTSQRPLTVADFDAFPEDDNRYEIIGGMLFVSPSPTLDHQRIAGRIYAALERSFDEIGTGEAFPAPVDVELSNFDIVEPDVVVVLDANASIKREKRVVGSPDIVVEVISPSSEQRDRVRKGALYALNGIPEYWVVDPSNRAFEVLTLRRGAAYEPMPQPAGTIQSQLLPEFDIDLDRLFRAPTGQTDAATPNESKSE